MQQPTNSDPFFGALARRESAPASQDAETIGTSGASSLACRAGHYPAASQQRTASYKPLTSSRSNRRKPANVEALEKISAYKILVMRYATGFGFTRRSDA